MAKTYSTDYTGIRYRKHATRRHGVKYDRYFFIRYRLNGKLREEGWGWESEGNSASDAFVERQRIKKAIKKGEEIVTLADRRAEAQRIRDEKLAIAEAKQKATITYGEFFRNSYTPIRPDHLAKHEETLHKYWIAPIIGSKTFSNITEFDLEKIKKRLITQQKAPRTVDYCYTIVRQVFDEAKKQDVYSGAHPVTKAVKKRNKYDNRKVRYLSKTDAKALLDELKKRSKQVHDMALLALYCGLRAGECFKLDWCDVNMDDYTVTLRDTKSSKTRTVPMPEPVVEMFKQSVMGNGNQPVFSKLEIMRGMPVKGTRIDKISKTLLISVQ